MTDRDGPDEEADMGGRGRTAAAVRPAVSADGGGRPRATAWLPRPTGPYPIGTTALRLTDGGREDPWRQGRRRELMVGLWYPTARPAVGGERARYMEPAAGGHFGGASGAGHLDHRVRPGSTDWSGILTHARRDAPARPGGPRPVVLYSPGLGDPRSWGTALAEDLASRGYVVVTVDHTYEASEVAFPEGYLATSLLPALLRRPGPAVGAVLRTALDTRVADTRFVLDELSGLRRAPGLPPGVATSPDLDRIGMVGHSAGGCTALRAMHEDPRIAAAVNLDGRLHLPGPDGRTGAVLPEFVQDGLDRPFLLMGTRGNAPGSHRRPGWTALRQHSTGRHAALTLDGSRSGSFTDARSLLPQLARQGAIAPGQLAESIGDIRPDRAELAVRCYLASFLDHRLRGHDDHLLDGPSARFPEMTYER